MLFKKFLNEVGLVDLQGEGCFFTWSNKRVDGFVAKKLDRILVSDHWLHSFSYFQGEFSTPVFSDHFAG